jgi:Entner-Doudoroff aldolase
MMAAKPAAHRLEQALEAMPIIAILRGLRTDEAIAVVEALFEAGIRVAEVPLNSPDPYTTIRLLVEHFGDRMLLGAGTVIEVAQVPLLAATGASLCVAPNTDVAVIRAAVDAGLLPLPGFQTPSEAFAGLGAGARYLKFFSAAGHTADLAALRAVLPRDARVIAVGGVSVDNVADLCAAGACAFGIGSDLYRPGLSLAAIRERAANAVAMVRRRQGLPVAELVCNPLAMIGESPLWRAASQQVVWVDPLAPRLLRAHRLDSEASELALSVPVWSLAALPSGQLGAAVEEGFAIIDETSGRVLGGPAAPMDAGCRFNDMTTDSSGGLWAGAMHRGLLAGRGSLYYAPSIDHPPRQVASGLGVPNGMAFSADQRTLYVIDTLARTLLAYPVDLALGRLGEPIVVTDFMGLPGKPDGMAIAADGSLWVAMWGGGCVVRIGADGALRQQLQVPAPHVSSVCTGPDGTLFATTSRMRMNARQLAEAPGAGGLFAIATI